MMSETITIDGHELPIPKSESFMVDDLGKLNICLFNKVFFPIGDNASPSFVNIVGSTAICAFEDTAIKNGSIIRGESKTPTPHECKMYARKWRVWRREMMNKEPDDA